MNGNYKPKIGEVVYVPVSKNWVEVENPRDYRERALLVRGAPMVGARVRDPRFGYEATVMGACLTVTLDCDDGHQREVPVCQLAPVPDEDEADVKRVAEALFYRDNVGHLWSQAPEPQRVRYVDSARAAIRAMKGET